MDLEKYKKIFAQEASKYLDELDIALIRIENDLSDLQMWGEIHGKVHSIKGMAKALSMERIAELCHSMEEWCKQFQGGDVKPSDEAVQLLIDGTDLLKRLVAAEDDVSSSENLKEWDRITAGFADSPDGLVKRVTPEVRPVSSPSKIDRIQVDYSLVEELLARSQEIMLLENRLPPLSQDQISTGLRSWIDNYMSMLKGLHFQLARMRLMPVNDFGSLFEKTIRDLGKTYNRDVRFEVAGGDIQVDIGLLDRLREPFMHLLRNSIAHGIEPPDERIKRGKNQEGKIVLEANKIGNSLVLKVSDDGGGIDRSAIIKYLKNKRSMSDEEISRMPDDEFFNSILSVDFSSTNGTTQLSGRGIGMDVVARAIEYLNGSMSIHSEPSKGTQFTIQLPLSLSIVYAIVCKLGEHTLSIPTSNVASIEKAEAVSSEQSGAFSDLGDRLGIDARTTKPTHILKIRQPSGVNGATARETTVRFAVDSVIGNMPLMVMPLGELLARAGSFAGVGIMENGGISILLDMDKF